MLVPPQTFAHHARFDMRPEPLSDRKCVIRIFAEHSYPADIDILNIVNVCVFTYPRPMAEMPIGA
jgi:hypothetical protein